MCFYFILFSHQARIKIWALAKSCLKEMQFFVIKNVSASLNTEIDWFRLTQLVNSLLYQDPDLRSLDSNLSVTDCSVLKKCITIGKQEIKKALGKKLILKNNNNNNPLTPSAIQFLFSKYLQQTYCALWICSLRNKHCTYGSQRKEKNNAYTSSNVHSFTLYTDRHWNQEAERWPNVPVHRLSQTRTHTTWWARHSKYAEWICEMQSYLHIHLYSDKSEKARTVSTSRADSQSIEKWEHWSKTRATICLWEFFVAT